MAALLAQVDHLMATTLVHTDAVVSRMEPVMAHTQLTVDQTHSLTQDIHNRSIHANDHLTDINARLKEQQQWGKRQEEKQMQHFTATTNLAAVIGDIVQYADCEYLLSSSGRDSDLAQGTGSAPSSSSRKSASNQRPARGRTASTDPAS